MGHLHAFFVLSHPSRLERRREKGHAETRKYLTSAITETQFENCVDTNFLFPADHDHHNP